MNLALRTPDAQTHLRKNINHSPTEFVFRYFSPEKYPQSLNTNQNASGSRISSKNNNSNLQSSQIAQQAMNSCRRKIQLDPQKHSDKFYNEKIQQVKQNSQNFYEQFQKKLFRKINPKQPQQRKIKLRLIKSSKKVINETHYNQQQIKRVQINLKKQSRYQSAKSPSHYIKLIKDIPAGYGQRKPDLVIRLYNDKNKNQKSRLSQNKNNQYWPCYTPRPKTTSKRKGIRVYSSASTNKSSKIEADIQTFTQGNFTTGNNMTITNLNQNQLFKSQNKKRNMTNQKKEGPQKIGNISSTKQNKNSYLNNQQLRKRIDLTKKRVYSKSKLGKKQNPVSRALFPRDNLTQYHKFS